MANNWKSMSEMVTGLMLKTMDDPKWKLKIPPESVNPSSLCPPYHEIVPLARDGKDIGQIALIVGTQPVNDALQMANTASPEILPTVWLTRLDKIAVRAQAGFKMEDLVHALKNGDETVDIASLMKIAADLDMGYGDMTSMSAIKPTEAVWRKTGYAPWDENFNGLPEASLTVIGATPGVGKCLAKGTKVLLIDGTLKNVEDVLVGDKLMGPDSLPRTVKSISSGMEMMYWVRQNRGIDYRVNESHILSLKKSHTQYNQSHGDVVNISVRDWLGKSNYFKKEHKGYKVAVEYTYTNVEVEPYFMGLWLGDGSSADVSVYNVDKPVIDYLYEYANRLGKKISIGDTGKDCHSYSIVNDGGRWDGVSLQEMLFSFGVKNNKHIPHVYKSNYSDVRWELLAGLIDSDGYYNPKNNTYEITQKREVLAKDIKFLCDSLGLRTSITTKIAQAQTGQPMDVFRVTINGDLSKCPIRVERKRQLRTGRVDSTMTGIRIEKDAVDVYYGFTLDKDGLFLLEDMTVTHNTTLMIQIVQSMIKLKENKKKKAAIFTLEMTMGQITKRALDMADMTDAERDRVLLADGSFNVEQVYTIASRTASQHDLCMIAIDFADQLIEGEQTEAMMGTIYRSLAQLAKKTGIPVVLISQLNRQTYDGAGIPKINHLRYSGMAEAMSALIVLIYNPTNTVVSLNTKPDNRLVAASGKAYLIVGKARYGYKHGKPGAVMVDFDGATGWGTTSLGWLEL